MSEGYDLLDAIEHIDPRTCDYAEWVVVGQGLHHEGYPVEVWVDWSRRDPERFKPGECEKKWKGFGHETGEPVTGGTIVMMAKARGWVPTRREHHAMGWNDVIGGREAKELRERQRREQERREQADEPAIIDPSMIGEFDADVRPLYPDGHGADELRDFLDAMFEDGEYVGYVITAETGDNGRMVMQKGIYSRTAGTIKKALPQGLDDAIGTINPKTGAWIRVNPLDGQGVGNANVTDYRHALLESDEMPIGKFAAIVRQLNIPVTAMVDSGGKSLHVLVKIDAEDAKEYKSRVETLYARCEKNGIIVDRANKNPSRLCRLPGAMRDGRRQFLAGLASGAADWDEWCEWYEAETDELPDAAPLGIDLDGERPKTAPELIHGVLRKGDKMLLAGPSKAGKSFALMELCAAFADGSEWFGHKCERSRTLYVNLELTEQSCKARFYDVFNAIGAKNVNDVGVWNLKGRGAALSKLKTPMIRRVRKTGAEVIVIDPIYKVMMGDESSARDISEFTNTLDEIVEESGCSLIYCHHHSKGYQGEKRSIDRASGSGVFGRDADAIVDMIELDASEWAHKHTNERIVAKCRHAVEAAGGQWTEGGDADTQSDAALKQAGGMLDEDAFKTLYERCTAIAKTEHTATAWRISYTLREFERMEPTNMWFDWPVHVIDQRLAKCPELGAEQPKPRGEGRQTKTQEQKKNEAIAEAVESCIQDDELPTRANVFDRLKPVSGGKKVKRDTFDKWTAADNKSTGWCEWKAVEKEDGNWVLERGGA